METITYSPHKEKFWICTAWLNCYLLIICFLKIFFLWKKCAKQVFMKHLLCERNYARETLREARPSLCSQWAAYVLGETHSTHCDTVRHGPSCGQGSNAVSTSLSNAFCLEEVGGEGARNRWYLSCAQEWAAKGEPLERTFQASGDDEQRYVKVPDGFGNCKGCELGGGGPSTSREGA